ncbi:MAG: hypothetical protein ABI254_06955 [Chthoniobacterales bacterium]
MQSEIMQKVHAQGAPEGPGSAGFRPAQPKPVDTAPAAASSQKGGVVKWKNPFHTTYFSSDGVSWRGFQWIMVGEIRFSPKIGLEIFVGRKIRILITGVNIDKLRALYSLQSVYELSQSARTDKFTKDENEIIIHSVVIDEETEEEEEE